MKYRYRYVDQMIDQIEGLTDPAHRMAVVWANQDCPNLKVALQLLYDYRYSFEVSGIPDYQRKRAAGCDFHTAVKNLDRKLNQRVIGAGQKFSFLIDILQQLQDRDAGVLERILKNQIDLRIPLEDIKRAFPMIEGSPNLGKDAPKEKVLSELKFPATVVHQLQGPEVRVEIGVGNSFKFVDHRGRGLILPDKPKSAFCEIFAPFSNIVLCASFQGLTKDQSKVGNTATTNAAFAKFQAGELEVEAVSITILDVIDKTSYINYPAGNRAINMSFDRRLNWLTKQDWHDSIFVKLAKTTAIASLEELRAFENEVVTSKETLRIYEKDTTWAEGFSILTKEAF